MIRYFLVLLFTPFFTVSAQSAWPSQTWTQAASLTSVMDAFGVLDLSGLHWNPDLNRLYLVQGSGRVRVLQLNTVNNTFTQIGNKSIDGGPEGITQVDFAANEFYTIAENAYEIRRYSNTASFSSITELKHWNLLAAPSPMTDTGNDGPEGIAFIPDSALSSIGFVSQLTGTAYTSVKGMGGLLFIAHQDGGYIWVFDVNPNVNNDFVYVGKYKTNRIESCDLSFDRTTGMLYILHNVPGNNRLEVTDLATSMVNGALKFNVVSEYFLPTPASNDNIEGFAITPKCPSESNTVKVFLCRDVESNESATVQQDVLRWFSPFVADGNCENLSTGNLTIDENPSIFPNPGVEQTSITFAKASYKNIKIYNSLGQQITEKNTIDTTLVINTDNWKSGIYLFQISENGKTFSRKFIKT
ncbi:MAG: T9SS type A sorting domain-containing protein [Flavobacterium sp.]|nr:T9SS type A sorting domain-containing protein [Flavobacterium sp.]